MYPAMGKPESGNGQSLLPSDFCRRAPAIALNPFWRQKTNFHLQHSNWLRGSLQFATGTEWIRRLGTARERPGCDTAIAPDISNWNNPTDIQKSVCSGRRNLHFEAKAALRSHLARKTRSYRSNLGHELWQPQSFPAANR